MNPNTTVSDADSSIVQGVFGLVKENLSEAQRRKDAASGERGAGKGAAALVSAQRWRDPERDQRTDSQLTGSIYPSPFCRSHPRLVPMNTQSGILCDPASLVLYGRCQASSRPHARFRKGESRRTLSEPFSPFESKPCIIHTCKEYPGAQLRSARCCSSRPA